MTLLEKELKAAAQAFAKEMFRELQANRHKGGRASWREARRIELILDIFHHTAKLHAAVLEDLDLEEDSQDSPTEREMRMKKSDETRERIRELAADVGNLAMMVADGSNVLDLPVPEV